MKQNRTPLAGAALIMSAAALLATPAFAQDAAQAPAQSAPAQTSPAPATPGIQTAPVAHQAAPVAVTPPPVVRTLPIAPSDDTSVTLPTTAAPSSQTDDAQPAANNADATSAAPARHATARAPIRHAERAATRPAATQAPAIAPAATAPAATAPKTAPSVATDITPTAAPADTAPPSATADQAPHPAATTTTAMTRTTGRPTPIWPWALLIAMLAIAAAGIAMWRRRAGDDAVARTTEIEPTYVGPVTAARAAPVALAAAEPAYLEPAPVIQSQSQRMIDAVPAAAPLVDAPLVDTTVSPEPAVAEDATLATADADEVASLTGGNAPVADRPWLEFAMRPVRAGTNVDEALVEIELTVGNAGSVSAEDVRIATFMLPAGADGEMDRLLSDAPVDSAVEPLRIAPGEGTRVDATLALSRAELGAGGAGFRPVIVADARYRLADGSEGRTSASFLIGGTAAEGDVLEPFDLTHIAMREDVEAQLYREPQRV